MAKVLIDFEKDLCRHQGVQPGHVFHGAVVRWREELGHGVIRFTVAREDSEALPGFLPGQYISVGVTLPDGARQLRQYSLVNGAEEGMLTFAVKRVPAQDDTPAGEVSNWLGDHAEEGSVIDVTVPFGDLVIDVEGEGPVALISNGIGATPMMGMLEALHAAGSKRPIVVAHAEASEAEDVFRSERAALIADLPNATEAVAYSRTTEGEAGERLSIGALNLPTDASVYLCGSTRFLTNARAELQELGFADDQVHFELFAPNDWLLDA